VQFFCKDTALKITTDFSDDVHFTCTSFKITINADFIYIPVQATFSTSSCGLIIAVNILMRMVYRCLDGALTLIPAKQFNRTHFT